MTPLAGKAAVVTGGGRGLGAAICRDLDTLQDTANVAQAVVVVLQMPAETVIPEIMVLPRRESSWP